MSLQQEQPPVLPKLGTDETDEISDKQSIGEEGSNVQSPPAVDSDGGGGGEQPEVTDTELRREYIKLMDAHKKRFVHDKADVSKGLRRERWFTVDYNRMSRNKLWTAREGPECQYYDGTPEEYRDGQEVWPRGRDLNTIGIYSQAYDFFRFMWNHTKPCKVVLVIMVMALMKPFQVLTVSYVVQYIEANPKTAPLWVYYINFIGYLFEKWLYWRYEMLIPCNSQRVQMRCVLLQQRARLPHDHPVAKKWPTGRFIGLLKDVDNVIDWVWESLLNMIQGLTTMFYFILVCIIHLGLAIPKYAGETVGVFFKSASLFLFLGLITMAAPVIWFRLFDSTVQECEQMIRDGQSLYMSAAHERLTLHERGGLIQTQDQPDGKKDGDAVETSKEADRFAVVAFWLYGRATFRSYFHQLAWQTNFGILSYLWAPLVAYFLLNKASFASAEILVILLSLYNIQDGAVLLLNMLISMDQGLKVLRDVAEILNANLEDYEPTDLEVGGSVPFVPYEKAKVKMPFDLESLSDFE